LCEDRHFTAPSYPEFLFGTGSGSLSYGLIVQRYSQEVNTTFSKDKCPDTKQERTNEV